MNFSNIIIFCATTLGTIAFIAACLFILYHHFCGTKRNAFIRAQHLFLRIHDLFFVCVSIVGAYFISVALKHHFSIPRPFVLDTNIQPLLTVNDFGFPSSHAAIFSALGLALYMVDRRAGAIFLLIALIIGLARILAGVHSPLDIAGGYLLGILLVLILHAVDKKLTKNRAIC